MNTRAFPDSVLPGLPWSLTEPVPESEPAFRAALANHAQDIESEFDLIELDVEFPGRSLDIRYTYDVSNRSGEWKARSKVVRIRSKERLTYGRIVFELHRAVHHRYDARFHQYFDGLRKLTQQSEDDVPTYELLTKLGVRTCLKKTTIQAEDRVWAITLHDARQIKLAVERYLATAGAELQPSVHGPSDVFIDCQGTVRMGMWLLEPLFPPHPTEPSLTLSRLVYGNDLFRVYRKFYLQYIEGQWEVSGYGDVTSHLKY